MHYFIIINTKKNTIWIWIMDDLDIISATSWRQVFLEENTGIFGENYRPTNVPHTNDKPDQLY
jgi:hypothetical protein